jgi:histidyl-tRNA synthetase
MTYFEILKGTRDYEGKDMILLNSIIDIIRESFEKYGFLPFDTPIIEYIETLTNKYDEDAEIVQEIFKLKDRGNRNLGLRYDLTVPLCRFIASKKQLSLPFRRYAIGKNFRDGPIKKGRLREFIQCDADVIGIKDIRIETELMEIFYKTYQKLGINSIIELNNNKILRGILKQLKFDEKNFSSIILSIDKLKKIGREGVIKEIKEKNIRCENIENVLELLFSNSFEKIEKIAKEKLLLEGIKELKELIRYLDKLEIKYRVNFSMSRGLNIYTGNIWEVYDLDENVTSSIGSGGRYDSAIGNFIDNGKSYPAVGISFGIVPIMECISKIKGKKSLSDILINLLEEDFELNLRAMEIANKLRDKGNNVEIYYANKIKKAFEYCDKMGIENIIVLGKRDLKGKSIILKNLKDKKETIIEI